jgi:hypothetical protein
MRGEPPNIFFDVVTGKIVQDLYLASGIKIVPGGIAPYKTRAAGYEYAHSPSLKNTALRQALLLPSQWRETLATIAAQSMMFFKYSA